MPTYGTTKQDKIKAVLALINELQLQDSISSDKEIDISASSKCNGMQTGTSTYRNLGDSFY
jgi:hypothetical protein